MNIMPMLLALLLIPTAVFAQDATTQKPEQAEPEPVMCLISTSLDDGNETLTSVHAESQLLLGLRGSVKFTVRYETRLPDTTCKQLTLQLPADGEPGSATVKVGSTTTLTIESAGVMSHANGQLVLTGDSFSSLIDEAPVS